MANETNKPVRRAFTGLSVESRAADEDGRTLVGHASVFNSIYDVGWFREVFTPGAFTASIAHNDDVRALIEHDPARVIGRRKSGTLRLSEDDRGLRCEIDLPDTQEARDLIIQVERGDRDQMSIQFRPIIQEWDKTDPDHPLRTISEADLIDVSVVTFPASDATAASVRAMENEFDAHKRQANYSNAGRRLRMRAQIDHRKRGL